MTPVPKNDQRYRTIEKYAQNTAHGKKVRIKSILRIDGKDVYQSEPFVNKMLLWHGTSKYNVDSILRNGLKIPNRADRKKRIYGEGIYTTTTLAKALKYCDRAEQKFVFLCVVNPGRKLHLSQPHTSKIPSQYDAVEGHGKYEVDISDCQFMSQDYLVPQGQLYSTGLDAATNEKLSKYSETVIYDESRAKIRYLVEFHDEAFKKY